MTPTLHLTELRFKRGTKFLRNTQAVHRTLKHVIADTKTRFLWAAPKTGVLIVQAQHPVRPSGIAGVYESHSAQRPMDHPRGATVQFAIIANPTQKLVKQRNRTPLPPEKWGDWLQNKIGNAITTTHLEVTYNRSATGTRLDGNHPSHLLVAFSGMGTVKNPDALTQHIANGIGPGKAYGAGLLLTKTVHQ